MRRQPRHFTAATVICAVVFCSTAAQSRALPGARPAAASSMAAAVVDLTNVERTHHGREPVRANPRLMRAAQIQADQMAHASELAHVLPKAAYPRTQDRLAAVDYRWQAFGENVAFGQSSAAKVLDDWMHSPGHRTNILNPEFTELGAGYAIDRAGEPFYVQVFARPSS